MKKLFKITTILLVLGSTGLLFTGFRPPVPAVGLNLYNNCMMLDGSGELITADAQFINGPQSNLGNVTIRCQAVGLTNNKGQAIVMKGSSGSTCFAFGMETTNWHQVITPDGAGTLICIFP